MSTPRRSLLKSAAAVGGAALGVSASAVAATPAAAADVDTTPVYPSSTVKPLGSVSGTVPLNLEEAGTFTCTLTGDVVFQFQGWPTGGVAVEPTVIATQDSAGGHGITYQNVTWLPDGSVPVFRTGAGAVNINSFFSDDNGTTVYGQGGTAEGGGFGVYGDGSDGEAILDGTKTYPFLGKSTDGKYYWLQQDVYLTALSVMPGITLQLAGGSTGTYRLFCTGLVTIAATGRIVTYTNTNASGATAGSNLATGTLMPGVAGPAGTTGAGAAGTGVLGEDGAAGAGGSAKNGATAGGTGGVSALTDAVRTLPRALPWASMMAAFAANLSGATFFPGGASGGAGAGDGTAKGGAGGAGGNPLFMAAYSIVNNGSIIAFGGKGGIATTGNAGGGGGGQGGPVMLIHSGYSGSGGAISSSGGLGGTGLGTGAAGTAGGASWIVELVN